MNPPGCRRNLRGWLAVAAALGAWSCARAGDTRAPSADAGTAVESRNGPAPTSTTAGVDSAVHKADPMIGLPSAVGPWKRPNVPRTVTARDIFEYMDGAGELYLGYRFDHLDVYDYASPADGSILVELYWMKTSDDAFGLLSNDWGGEPVVLAPGWSRSPVRAIVPPHRALYGAGLLRMWCDRLYARILAAKETSASRQAVLDIGRTIAAGAGIAAPPSLVSALPLEIAPNVRVRPDHVWFLRSYLVLNSAYFLATENILDLELSAEAAVAPYGPVPPVAGQRPSELILVRYATADDARRALTHFREAYLPESLKGTSTSGLAAPAFTRIEDGWVGYRVIGRAMALALQCSSRAHAQRLIESAVRGLERMEAAHDD